jgi:photosystem II stability/assembly factor-like uncharacterized protein
MTRFTRLFLFLGAFFLIAHNSFADGFNSVFSKDGINVIAVGNAGNVFRSGNGGGNYGSNPLGSADLKCVFAINQKVWIGTVNGAYYSTDGGNTFTLTALAGNTINSVCFVDDNTGWIIGSGGYVSKSTNGGVSYVPQNSTVAVNLNSVKFINANTGVACGNSGTILYTINGGSTWLTKPSGTTNDLLCIDYKSPNAIATAAFGIILKSINDCTTWSTINYNIETKSDVRGVSMVTPTQFYTGGGGGFIRRTNDGGTTYSFQSNPMMAPLSSINFTDANSGFAVSSTMNGILYTHDGGATWNFQQGVSVVFSWIQKQAAGSGNIGNGFAHHPLNRNGLFIMMNNTLYKSLDRGETWTNIGTCSIGDAAHTLFVSPVDTNIMLCSKGSAGGYVCRSTDHGVTWTSVWGPGTLTSYGMPMEIDENNPSIYYLAPDTHVMMRSTDNGLTFSDWGNHTFRSPCDIAVQFGNSNIMLVGDGVTNGGQGDFWKSTDNGVNWTMIQTVTGSEIPMIASTNQDPNLFYHTTWSSGGFWKSADAGSTFVITSGPQSSLWAADISKDDPTAIAYDVYGSSCYFSTDNGNNFITTNVGSTPAAGMYYYDKANLYVEHGGGVYKLVITYSVLTSNSQISSETPKEFSLNQNFPNPFNPTTQIQYNISKSSYVSIKVYDVVGNEVTNMVNQNLSPGKYKIDFDASSLSSGVYFYSLFDNGSKVDSKKMILIK